MSHNTKYVRSLLNLSINYNQVSNFVTRNMNNKLLDNTHSYYNWWKMFIPDEDEINIVPVQLRPYLRENIMLTVMLGHQKIKPHVDMTDNFVAINIPYQNCNSNTITTFYEYPNDELIFQYRPDYSPMAKELLEIEKLIPKYSFSLHNHPVLFRTHYPHSVLNTSNDVRIMISWRFKTQYDWADAIDICNDLNYFKL